MFESRHEPLAPKTLFLIRLMRNTMIGILVIAISLFLGMCGYHYFEMMPWVDAFVNAAMILSGMGPLGSLTTSAGKIFAGFYALFSGLVFILAISLIFAPIIHRYFHKFHLDTDVKSNKH